MQDNYTGNMVPIFDLTQDSKDAALPRERQGIVLIIGEEVEVKGGRFVVQNIGRHAIVLRGLPGTDIRNGPQ